MATHIAEKQASERQQTAAEYGLDVEQLDDQLSAYLRAAGKHRLLTAAEEVALSVAIHAGIAAARELKRILAGDVLTDAAGRRALYRAVQVGAESQQELAAKTTRVCIYDRAGTGWSEASPQPRTIQQFVKELHTVLTQASIPGPYVLVRHSLGGLTMRLYAHTYPADIAGIVLVESMNPGSVVQSRTDIQTPLRSSFSADSIVPGLAQFGVVRLLARPLGLIFDNGHYLRQDVAAFKTLFQLRRVVNHPFVMIFGVRLSQAQPKTETIFANVLKDKDVPGAEETLDPPKTLYPLSEEQLIRSQVQGVESILFELLAGQYALPTDELIKRSAD